MISNSTPLICLAKINKLELLKKLFKSIIITKEVEEEVLISGKPGYAIIKNAIDEGWIKIKKPLKNIDFGLGKGENSAINLANEEKDKLIIDDAYAIKICNSLNIAYLRTTSIILYSLKNKLINKDQAKDAIHNLVENGYYISPAIFSELLRTIDSV